jgi:hypothetical protein
MNDPLIVLVGCGALGSHLVVAARNLPVRWRLVDGDRVDAGNTRSQAYVRACTGMPKASALTRLLAQQWGLKPEARDVFVRPDNVAVLLAGAVLVVDATDRAEARRLLRDHSSAPCLHVGVSAGGDYGRLAWSGVSGKPPFAPDDGEGTPTCADGAALPRLMLVASLAAEVLRAAVAGEGFADGSVSPRHIRMLDGRL